MGILDSIFGKKKKDSSTQELVVEPDSRDLPKAVVNAGKRKELLAHADTGLPVVICGGDFAGKTVFVVSKPSKERTRTFDRKTFPIVTVDRLSIGTYEEVVYRGGISEEEEKRLDELAKQRAEAAEKEKAEFAANRYKLEFEAHRFMRSAMVKPKPKPKLPKPERDIDEEIANLPIYRLDEEGNEIPIEREKPAPKPKQQDPWELAEEKAEDAWRNRPKENYVKEAHYNDVVPKEETYVYKFDQLIATLPEFDFYNGDSDKEFSENHPSVIALLKLQEEAAEIMLQAATAEGEKEWATAAQLYEKLVIRRYWKPEPYLRLMEMYSKPYSVAKVRMDMQSLIINFFKERREKMKTELLRLAKKYNSTIYAEKCINEGVAVSYYDGIFDIYDPYPVVEDVLEHIL